MLSMIKRGKIIRGYKFYNYEELELHEKNALEALETYFNVKITPIKKNNNVKTPDFLIKNVIWELKSPKGNGKRTMQNNLRDADDQSPNIIMDLSRCKMNDLRAISRIKDQLKQANKIKRLIVIKKSKKVVVIK